MADIETVTRGLRQVEQLSRDIGQDGWIQASLVPTVCRVELHRWIKAEYLQSRMDTAHTWMRPDGQQRRAMDPEQRRRKTALQNRGLDPSTWMPPAEPELFVQLTARGLLLATAHLRRPLPETVKLCVLLDARRPIKGETEAEASRRRANLGRSIRREVQRASHGRYVVADALAKYGAQLDEARLTASD